MKFCPFRVRVPVLELLILGNLGSHHLPVLKLPLAVLSVLAEYPLPVLSVLAEYPLLALAAGLAEYPLLAIRTGNLPQDLGIALAKRLGRPLLALVL
jgi:hypothetical protein|tara:strand:- start:7775 stop:8065 length:291 start_codon:yes stop_codon:yes gene_type:complete